jgi:hypothetical protein
MLIKTEFTIRNATEESLPRQLEAFAAWQPPEGMETQGSFFYADGSGGFSISEVPDAATAPPRDDLSYSPPAVACAHCGCGAAAVAAVACRMTLATTSRDR